MRGQQLIYTRLEAGFSPTGVSGLQTAWRSPDLTDADAAYVVSQVGSSPLGGDSGAVRMQYFQLPGGAFAFVRQVEVADAEIVDPHRGSFLSHAVILDPETFCSVDCDPFRVLLGYTGFVDDARQLLQRYLRPAGTVDQRLHLQAVPPLPDANIPKPVRLQILSWVLLSGELRAGATTLVLPGRHHDAIRLLRTAFSLVNDSQLRRRMTFSTVSGKCVSAPGTCWATADLTHSAPGFLRLRDDWTSAAADPALGMPPAGIVSKWLHTASRHLDSDELLQRGSLMVRLVECLEHREAPPQTTDAAVAAEFIALLPEKLTACLANRCEPRVPASCRMMAAELIQKSFTAISILQSACSRQPLTAEEVTELCCEHLLNSAMTSVVEALKLRDWGFLLRTAQKSRRPLYAAILLLRGCPRWVHPFLRSSRRRHVEQLNHLDFTRLLPMIPDLLRADYCCSPAHLVTLLKNVPLERIQNSDFVRLLRAADRCTQQFPEFDRIANRLAQLPSCWLLWLQFSGGRRPFAVQVRRIADQLLRKRINTDSLKTMPRNHF